MAFTLPSDLATNFVDNSSTVNAAYFNGVSAMGNALKSAISTWGFNAKTATVATSETTTSTTYTDLTTTTDQVVVPVGSSGTVLVIISASLTAPTGNAVMSYAMSGANTSSATDTKCLNFKSQNGSSQDGSYQATFVETGLTAGFTTFKLKYRSSDFNFTGGGGSKAFANRKITVIPMPATDGTHASASFDLNLSSSLSLGMGGAGVNRPTYDSVGAGTQGTSANGGTYTQSHTLGANAKCIMVAAMVGSGAGGKTITAKIGSTDIPQVYQRLVYSTTWQLVVFALLDPPTGAQTISLILPSGTNYSYSFNSTAYSGVKEIGTAVSPAAAGASPATQTVTTATVGGMIFHTFGAAYNGAACFSAYNQNQRAAISGATNSCNAQLVLGDANGAASVTFSATTSGTGTYNWGSIAIPLNGYTS